MTTARLLATIALFTAPSIAAAQGAPGRAVLEKMHAAYAGKWYTTLTFVQKTTFYIPGAAERVSTWWESIRYTPQYGVQLRIDRDDPAAGNGSLATADSTWIVRNGALAQVRGRGNEFLPLIEGVYVQPLDQTERQIRAIGVDMHRTHLRTWQGRPTTVVGTTSASDTTSTQFWIDDERQIVTRMIITQAPPLPANAPPGTSATAAMVLDVVLGGYERVGGGWLETKVDIFINGVLRQREEYTDWKVDIPLADALFDPARWTTAPHWGKRP